EGQPRPRGRLVEKVREDRAFQGARALLAERDRDHLLRGPQNELDVGARKFADREDVPPAEVRHRTIYSELRFKGYPARLPGTGWSGRSLRSPMPTASAPSAPTG